MNNELNCYVRKKYLLKKYLTLAVLRIALSPEKVFVGLNEEKW